ncbi:hypothetical protein B0T10DRAFT_611816 [Thelonectria olida]|uniref:C2H2-type domain-containing protein n=1 Tax=Thelonectria olida TaxID=1576542 RepID=A0A9P8VMQ3_9HYPO|nr:hypothetical protein B0T10DRAFT_611816 [Thelonectria olida]
MSNLPSSNTTIGSALSTADDPAFIANIKGPANSPPPKTGNPRPHVCGTCQRSFTRLDHLKRHKRRHTKEKPFECPECARCFARRDLLLRHQRKLHQISTPSSHPCNPRDSASGVFPGQSRARKNRVVGPKPAASNAPVTSMGPRANVITHVDGSTMQLVASANASVTQGAPSTYTHTHIQRPSLVDFPIYNSDHVLGGMSAAMRQRGVQHGQLKLQTSTLYGPDFSSGPRTVPPLTASNPECDFDSLLFGSGSAINPNALHYNDLPQAMALEQASPFAPPWNEMLVNQTLDNNFIWLTGFEHQMSINTSEIVVDGSSPSSIITTTQSGISDVMLNGLNQPIPAGMGSPQMLNSFAIDLNSSIFPGLLNAAPSPPQLASQKINGSYFSTSPPRLSSL